MYTVSAKPGADLCTASCHSLQPNLWVTPKRSNATKYYSSSKTGIWTQEARVHARADDESLERMYCLIRYGLCLILVGGECYPNGIACSICERD